MAERPSDVTMVGRQVGWEQKLFWRNPAAAGFSVLFPLLFLVIFSLTSNDSKIDIGHHLQVKGIQYYAAGLLVFGLISVSCTSLAINLTFRRDDGLLKRKRGTPLPAWGFVAGLIGSSMIVGVVLTAAVVAFARLAYGLTVPTTRLPTLVLVLLIGTLAFCAIGILMTAAIPNADAAPAIVNIAVFPLIFLSGVFFPVQNEVLNRVADLFPIRHFIGTLDTVFATPIGHQAAGIGSLPWADLAVIAAWGIVAAALASRWFRWEPAVT